MAHSLPEPLASKVAETIAGLARDQVVQRLWRRDHTLWSPSPREIDNRLGWLDYVPDAGERARIAALVEQARQEGVAHVVLLGMGGSRLGAEALVSSFPARAGWPRLLVLDSTVPEWVQGVRA